MTSDVLDTLFITQWFDPEPGALRGLPLARWLTRRGHRVQVLTGFPNYPGGKVYDGYRIRVRQREVMDGVPVVRVPLYPSHDKTISGRLANYGSFALSATTIGLPHVRRVDVGFVYHPPPTVALPAVVLRALRRVPFVYHIADMWPESVVESGALGQGRLRAAVGTLLHGWCNFVYRQASAITVLSEGFKRLLVDRGVPADKIHVIYNWADDDVFVPGPRDEALARELGLAGRFNVVYAGNLGVFQALDTVLRAAVLVRHVPDIQFVFVGTGQEEAALKRLAKEIGADNVRFVGRRQFWEMPKINDLADALLVHLRDLPFFATTIPSKTQVSLASGRPVIMAVRGDAAEVIDAAGAGLTCAPENPRLLADAILALHRTPPDVREQMGARGRAYYLEHMSLAKGAMQMDALLRSVAARSNGRRTSNS
jgi:glycosyltransferase involved in cell wall biosynthesis